MAAGALVIAAHCRASGDPHEAGFLVGVRLCWDGFSEALFGRDSFTPCSPRDPLARVGERGHEEPPRERVFAFPTEPEFFRRRVRAIDGRRASTSKLVFARR